MKNISTNIATYTATGKSGCINGTLSRWARCLPNVGHCALCLRGALHHIDLCPSCESLLTRLSHTEHNGDEVNTCIECGDIFHLTIRPVRQCATAVGDKQRTDLHAGAPVCQACLVKPHAFLRIISPYRYSFPLDRMIQALKYGKQRHFARLLGTLLAREVRVRLSAAACPDVLLPVPLHESRLANRGFNQARDIARWCAHDLVRTGLPVQVKDHANRVIDTCSLAGLSRAERQLRILGAFQANPLVADRRIAIIDDVLTTGSTARELARELYDTGARSVELWVLARTSSDRAPGCEIS